jgi:NADP-dependent 3-hydroxy acid dehydrogenase YdfG
MEASVKSCQDTNDPVCHLQLQQEHCHTAYYLNMASKVFIVTGASKGIGAAIARYLVNQSHKVVITARSSEPLEGLKKSHPDQVQFIAGDIVEPQVCDPIVGSYKLWD